MPKKPPLSPEIFARLAEEAEKMIPQVDEGATRYIGSDRRPATVIDIERYRGAVYVTIQDDRYEHVKGSGDFQTGYPEFRYYSNPAGRKEVFRLEIDRRREEPRMVWWHVYRDRETGRWNKTDRPGGVSFGVRELYHDPHF